MLFHLGGCTKYVQPADVCWNRSFKIRIQSLYTDWLRSSDHQLTPTGNMRAPSFEVFCSWVSDAWDSLPKVLISNSFKTCGISIATDGTEDDLISCFKKPELDGARDQLRLAPVDLVQPEIQPEAMNQKENEVDLLPDELSDREQGMAMAQQTEIAQALDWEQHPDDGNEEDLIVELEGLGIATELDIDNS